MNNRECGTLSPLAFGLSLGLITGVSMIILSLLALYYGIGTGIVAGIAQYYPGYGVTLMGMFMGLIFGFLDGFIGGVIWAYLYNFFLKKL